MMTALINMFQSQKVNVVHFAKSAGFLLYTFDMCVSLVSAACTSSRYGKCKLCGFLAKSHREIYKHFSKAHDILLKPWKCPLCDYRGIQCFHTVVFLFLEIFCRYSDFHCDFVF